MLPVEPSDLPEHLKSGPIIVTGGGGGYINSDPGTPVHAPGEQTLGIIRHSGLSLGQAPHLSRVRSGTK